MPSCARRGAWSAIEFITGTRAPGWASRRSSANVRRRRTALNPDDAVNVEVVDLESWVEEATRVDRVVDVGLLGTQVVGAHVGPEFLQGLEFYLRGAFKVVQRIPHPESFASRTDTLQGATMPYRHGFDNLWTKSKPPARLASSARRDADSGAEVIWSRPSGNGVHNPSVRAGDLAS